MNLVIDIGNTHTKVAVFKNEKLVARKFFHSEINFSLLKNICEKHKEIRSAILCSVANTSTELKDLLKKNYFLVELNERTKLPVKNLYKTPKMLGKDRLANAVGTNFLFPQKNVLIVDAGTCIKYDFVNHKSEYLGGAISPGIDMRFKALNNFTAKLPLIKRKNDFGLIGCSTEKSILSGVQNGVVAEISGIIQKYEKQHKGLKIIFTGGDASFILSQISEKNRIFAVPNLTLVGLNVILNASRKI